MSTVRVATYNLLNGGVGREQRLVDVVGELGPDIAVFTEATAPDVLAAVSRQIGPHCVGRHGTVIVSRWPISPGHADSSQLPLRSVSGIVRPHRGESLAIIGVHLMPQPLWACEAWRSWQVERIVRRARAGPAMPRVIAGDFNTLMAGDSFRRDGAPPWVRLQWALQGGWPRWALEKLPAAGFVDCYRACRDDEGYTVPAKNPGVRLDYVFASSELGASLCGAGVERSSQSPSDHLPVWVDFAWPCRRRSSVVSADTAIEAR
jgi:endonuclease/exonuclease/phosphatase family metal-dependent hydrolase